MKWMLLVAKEEDWLWLGSMTPAARERLIMLGAVLAVVLAVAVWALFLRSKRRHRSRRHHHRRRNRSTSSSAPAGVVESNRVVRTRERRRRREHRPRNPTLAQTGGLPPVRPEGPADPPATQMQSP